MESSGIIGGDEDDDDDDDDDWPTRASRTDQCGINHNPGQDPEKDYDGDGFPLKERLQRVQQEGQQGARDIPGNNIDEDRSGAADDEATSCDDNLDVAPGDAYEAAAAMGPASARRRTASVRRPRREVRAGRRQKMSGNMLNVGGPESATRTSRRKASACSSSRQTSRARRRTRATSSRPTCCGRGRRRRSVRMPTATRRKRRRQRRARLHDQQRGVRLGRPVIRVKIQVPSNAKAFQLRDITSSHDGVPGLGLQQITTTSSSP